MSILALQKKLGLGSYDKLHGVLSGKRRPSVAMAQKIEAATGGAIRWTEFFEPVHVEPPAGAA